MAVQTDSGGDTLLWCEGLSKSHDGIKTQFKNVDLVLSRGQRLGLVGANGTGKSTLMKILAQMDQPDSGNVQFRKGLVTAYVEQDPKFPPGSSISDAIYGGSQTPVMQALRAYELATEELTRTATEGGAAAEKAQARFATASEKMDSLGAWDADVLAKRVISAVLPAKFHSDLGRKVDGLSGGERKRVALCAALLQKPDLLLMDEPTNHLDVPTIQARARARTHARTCARTSAGWGC